MNKTELIEEIAKSADITKASAARALDAVIDGSAEMSHGAAYYWQNKSQALSFFTGVPFGMTSRELTAWVRYLGGLITWDYWVLDHAEDYSWFISADPTFDKLWIYTREVPDAAERRALQAFEAALPPPLRDGARRARELMTGQAPHGGTLFEELGFSYIGPIDGHDVLGLVDTIRNMRNLKGPQLLHIVTKKGKGYAPAEADPIGYHAVSKFDPAQHKQPEKKAGKPSFSNIFGQWICDMAEQDERLQGITPAMREGSGMVAYAERFPDRYYDVAIAEQHAVTLAAGMACEGLKPVVAIYSTFLQRGYDQLVHDVAVQNLDVLFAIDRAGLVGR